MSSDFDTFTKAVLVRWWFPLFISISYLGLKSSLTNISYGLSVDSSQCRLLYLVLVNEIYNFLFLILLLKFCFKIFQYATLVFGLSIKETLIMWENQFYSILVLPLIYDARYNYYVYVINRIYSWRFW